jgi:hypothetical protein
LAFDHGTGSFQTLDFTEMCFGNFIFRRLKTVQKKWLDNVKRMGRSRALKDRVLRHTFLYVHRNKDMIGLKRIRLTSYNGVCVGALYVCMYVCVCVCVCVYVCV